MDAQHHDFHVIVKTNRGEIAFDDRLLEDELRASFALFGEAGGSLLAYAFMGNHLHLWVRVPDIQTLSRVMRDILAPIARYRNYLWGQGGVVFRQNFFRKPVTSLSYQLYLGFYIHSNVCPRSENIADLSCGDRTSHDAWLSKARPWLNVEAGLELYGGRAAYLDLCRSQMPRLPTLGLASLVEPLAQSVLLGAAREFGVHPDKLLDPTRRGSPDRVAVATRLMDAGVARVDIGRILTVNVDTLRSWLARQTPAPFAREPSPLRWLSPRLAAAS